MRYLTDNAEDNAAVTDVMHADYLAGKGIREIAETFGVSYQAVQYRLRSVGCLMRAPGPRGRDPHGYQEFARHAEQAVPCCVCGYWVLRLTPGLRSANRTCSTRCADIWVKARLHIDPEQHERHRISVAKSTLRNPGRCRPSLVTWARRILEAVDAGLPLPPPNRRYIVPGSRAAQALEEA